MHADRHDEAWEKEVDRIRTEIAESHRFESFGAPRDGNAVKWYIDGHNYFYALSTILDNAKETIQILDWWLSPELFLRRPPSKHEDFRLDRLLLRKAEQGVKIQIMVYKEVTQTMTMSSSHTKHHMEDMHENIAVMRHPDHMGGEMTMMWVRTPHAASYAHPSPHHCDIRLTRLFVDARAIMRRWSSSTTRSHASEAWTSALVGGTRAWVC